jgi:transcription elongation factor Elf1
MLEVEDRPGPDPEDAAFACPLCASPLSKAAVLADLEGLDLLSCRCCGAVLAA